MSETIFYRIYIGPQYVQEQKTVVCYECDHHFTINEAVIVCGLMSVRARYHLSCFESRFKTQIEFLGNLCSVENPSA